VTQPATRIELVLHRDLRDDHAAAKRIGVTLAQLRSIRAHPLARPDDPVALVASRGDTLVGRFGFLPGRLRIGTAEHRISWGSDWRVDERYRGHGVGGLLLIRAMAAAPDLAGVGPSAEAIPIYRAARFTIVDIPRYVLLVRSREILRARAGRLGATIGPLVDRGLPYRRLRSGGAALTRVERFDAEVDAFETGADLKISFPRDSAELNWALDHPWLPPELAAFRAYTLASAGQTIGYALARLRMAGRRSIGSILRAAVAGPEHAPALVTEVTLALGRDGADLVELCTTDPWLVAAAERVGLARRAGLHLIARLAGPAGIALASSGHTLEHARAAMGDGDVIFS